MDQFTGLLSLGRLNVYIKNIPEPLGSRDKILVL